jgi:hypothetical protein
LFYSDVTFDQSGFYNTDGLAERLVKDWQFEYLTIF